MLTSGIVIGIIFLFSVGFAVLMLGRRQLELAFLMTISPLVIATSVDRKEQPVKRHFISQEIYENKPGYTKRKDTNKKEKDYKSKEDQQELSSLEKAMAKKHRKKERAEEVQAEVKSVVINSVLTVGELADKINKSSAEVVKYLMMNGIYSRRTSKRRTIKRNHRRR